MSFIEKIIGTKNDRELKKLQPRVQAINSLESKVEKYDDAKLASRLAELKNEVNNALKATGKADIDIDKNDLNKALDPVVEETFAIVREAGKRVLGMRHYDVQMIGGLVLNSGRIAEMKTGEGKTLVATLPSVLNTLTGGSVHVVTVNDYLASRDAEWMGRIYRFLGLSVGVVVARQGDRLKKEAYEADITYGQNNEFGFDYLRDNMKFTLKDYKQRGHFYAVVDEVDSILIDEARTPLIISGPAEDNSPHYRRADAVVPQLRKDEHYTIDEKSRNCLLTETGVMKVEQILGLKNLYDPVNIETLHHVTQALKAHTLYKRDQDYVVDGGEVVIVDEHTGRLMPGRRWSDGLHGAVEAKENVRIQPESTTLATISFQNYFRLYKKLSGMTGTADTEAEEFAKIYDLDVLVIPTNRPIQRVDDEDLIYKTEPEKVVAVAEDIAEHHKKGVPVLVGTTSVEKSEVLSNQLKKFKIPHNVLNAKRHREEAAIVAQAGRSGKVTIATNMAGRGTDILLGGNAEFMARTEVAEIMGETDDQVAEFAFLSGRPDLIMVEKLAERDKKNMTYLAPYEEAIDEIKQAAEERGEEPDFPEGMPVTREDMQEAVYEERLEFYKTAVELYTEKLAKHDAEAKAEKAKVLEAGGLRIIGTERHESRRIDNQLRGRAGRQGDPGSSRFYLSLEDDLMRIFGSERMIRIMETLGMEDGVPIEHGMVTKSIANAQKRVEGMHFDSRKNLLEYDDVMNQQRKAVYGLRRQILEADPSREVPEGEKAPDPTIIRELFLDLIEESIVNLTTIHCPEKTQPAEWKVTEIEKELHELSGVLIDLSSVRSNRDDIMDKAFATIEATVKAKIDEVDADIFGQLVAFVYLQTIDARWKEHLGHMDHLREGIHMRAYGQRDPKQEYKKEGYNMFLSMRSAVRDEVIEKVLHAQISRQHDEGAEQIARMWKERQKKAEAQQKQSAATHPGAGSGTASTPPAAGRPSVAGPMSASMPSMAMGGPSIAGPTSAAPMPSAPPMPQRAASLPPQSAADLNRAQRRQVKAKSKRKVKLK